MNTLVLRAYSYRELHTDSWGGYDRILPDGEYAWVACSAGLRRYNRQTDTFSRVEYGQRGVGLIAKIDGTLFGHAWLNDDLCDRPCIIDRKTLLVTPILIETEVDKKPPCLNGPFSFFGTYKGRLVFGDNQPGYAYNAEIGKLQDIGKPWDRPDDPIDTILPDGFRGSELWWPQPIRSAEVSGHQPLMEPICVRRKDGNRWTLFLSPDRSNVAGMRNSSTTRYEYPAEDWPFRDIIWDRREGNDGLFFVTRDGEKTPITATPHGDVLTGTRVFMVVPNTAGRDGVKTWICTGQGLSVLDSQSRVLANFTRRDGLCGNRIPTGVAADGRMFFGSAWGDHGGGLIVADPSTAVFTAYFQSDGLGTDKIALVEKVGDALRLTYDVEYGRNSNSYRYRVMTPNRFDPAAGRPIDRATAKYNSQLEANAAIAAREGTARTLTPYLGGFVISEQTIGGVKYICSTRGLVIANADDPLPPLAFDTLKPQLTIDPHVTLKAVADSMSIRIISAADFNRLVASDNPYLRYRALTYVRHLTSRDPRPFLPALRRLTQDELPNTRRVAAQILGEAGDVSAVGYLRRLLNDKDRAVRDDAAIALARVGSLPKLELFERMLEQDRDSSRRTQIISALAEHATPEVFALLLKHPLHTDDYEPRNKAFAALGMSLLKHPEAAAALLKAYNTDRDAGPESNYGSTRFAQEVFKYAGEKMLPVLHAALKSDDRVVRSNAARACGELKNPSSIQPLLAALDLESGLSRGSIVWALGELKVAEALPRLAELYVDARNDERRGHHTGYRFAQAAAQMQSQFESISRIDAIGADFDELSRIAEPKPIRPRQNEPLLKPDTILQAVRKIGPESSQEFYRTLAAEDDTQARQEAATQLAKGDEQNVEENRPILRNLLADPDTGVRMTAAVSLLLLGETGPQKQILVWLGGTEPYPKYQMVEQLERIQDGKKLIFARDSLTRFAAAEQHRNTYQHQRLQRLLQRIP
jgi:HEAT repeat protein